MSKLMESYAKYMEDVFNEAHKRSEKSGAHFFMKHVLDIQEEQENAWDEEKLRILREREEAE